MMEQSGNQGESAATRLVMLALLADGDSARADIGLLERLRAFDLLGVRREDFAAAVQAYCDELREAAVGGEGAPYLSVGVQRIRGLLTSLQDRARQREIAGLMFRIIRADGRIQTGESLLLWEALDAWKLRLADVVAGVGNTDGRRVELRPPRVFRRRPGRAYAWSRPAAEAAYA